MATTPAGVILRFSKAEMGNDETSRKPRGQRGGQTAESPSPKK